MQREPAEEIARDALLWLLGNEDLLPVFLGATGVDAARLRDGAQDPEFLGFVLDFLLMDDAWVMAFCAAEGLGFEAPQQARRALPGGAEINWT